MREAGSGGAVLAAAARVQCSVQTRRAARVDVDVDRLAVRQDSLVWSRAPRPVSTALSSALPTIYVICRGRSKAAGRLGVVI